MSKNKSNILLNHNGKIIHEDIEVINPRRVTLWDDENPTSPLRLQGDHGPVAYRNLKTRRVEQK